MPLTCDQNKCSKLLKNKRDQQQRTTLSAVMTPNLVIEPDVHEKSMHVGSQEGGPHKMGQTCHIKTPDSCLLNIKKKDTDKKPSVTNTVYSFQR